MKRLESFKPAVGVRIAGTGLAVPRNCVTNKDLEAKVETDDAWIQQRTGIRQRHLCSDDETTSTLATAALKQALDNAGMEPGELDLVITGTLSPDMVSPTVSCQVVANLGAVPCGAIDMNLACTGFVAALNTAAAMVHSGLYRTVAVIGAERLSDYLNWDDRRTCVLFGDGAGAAILQATEDTSRGCYYQKIHSNGNKAQELYVPRYERDIVDPAVYNGKLNTLQMNGREVFKFAVTTLQQYLRSAMEACELTVDDLDMFIPHQSNARIIESARDKLGIPTDKVYVNLDRYGNTSAASVAICLHELTESKRIKEGDTLIFAGVGAGVTWATSVWKL